MSMQDGSNANQTALDVSTGPGSGGRITSIVSAMALMFSGYSMYETALKLADIKVYVTDTISYTRDPWGSFEVMAVPVTITNNGARDAAVVSLQLDVKNTGSGKADKWHATYTADAQYFGSGDDVAARKRRPKLPFAPLSISGRQTYTGTILFYPSEYKPERIVEPKSKIEMTLRLQLPQPDGWIERTFGSAPNIISLRADVPDFLPGGLLVGDMVRLRAAQSESKP